MNKEVHFKNGTFDSEYPVFVMDCLTGFTSHERIEGLVVNLSRLYSSEFHNCKIMDSDFKRSEISVCDFGNTDILNTNAYSSLFDSNTFRGSKINANLRGTEFVSNAFEDVSFIDCSFNGAVISGSVFTKCHFFNCSFDGAILDRCKIEDSVLKNCSFVGAEFFDTKTKSLTNVDCDFSNSKFQSDEDPK